MTEWAPADQPRLKSVFGECVVDALLLTMVILFLDRELLGSWMSQVSMGLVGILTLAGFWFYRKWRARRPVSRQAEEPPAERVIVAHSQHTPPGEPDRNSRFADFVRTCAETGDTSARRWESELGKEVYSEWRDALLQMGAAQWRGRDRRSGWRLTAEVSEILDGLR